MAGRSNRSTSSNVWKPPPDEGTTSPQRALRWQAAGQDNSKDKDSNDDSRSEKSIKSGSTHRSGGTTKSSSKSKKERKKKGQAAEEEKEKVPGQFEWYGDPLNPGIDASLGPGGSLYNFTVKGKPRAGMCNPPMNPAVREALVADLNNWQVQHIVSKKAKQENKESAGEKAKRKKIIVPPTGNRGSILDDEDGAFQSTVDALSAGAATAPAGLGGSMGSSRMSSPGPSTMRRHGSTPHIHKGKKKSHSAWQLDLTQDGKQNKHSLDSAPEGEVKWRSFQLKRQSRDHGLLLDKMEPAECAALATYHNSFSRGSLSHSAPQLHPVAPHRRLKDMGRDLDSTGNSLHERISVQTLESEFSPTASLSRSYYNISPVQEALSLERLTELAAHTKHMTPHKLQSTCQQMRISVHTAAKLPNQLNSPTGEDPLFSSRLGSTPRTSTGKPLPVLIWGRNGAAPMLREPQELQKARAAAEAAREAAR